VDYSWELYHNFQSLRTYRETRFNINPEGFSVQTSDRDDYREEKIDLPDGWLRGFLQLQAAMALPMKKVTLGVDAVYSLLAWLKRHREKHGPRAIRFELEDSKSPRIVLEPWNVAIESPSTVYHGAATEPVRIWGRRRLMSLARLLPLASQVDVYLLGTGLPSFWVVQMGNMRLTLGLSGWTTNDWTRGSAVQMLLPPTEPSLTQVASAAEQLSQQRAMTMNRIRTARPGNFRSARRRVPLATNPADGVVRPRTWFAASGTCRRRAISRDWQGESGNLPEGPWWWFDRYGQGGKSELRSADRR
jgi:hypothetical protein